MLQPRPNPQSEPQADSSASNEFQSRIEGYLRGACGTVEIEDALEQGDLFVDVRTFEEYQDGAIPTAVNVPLFDHLERTQIGILYKHSGPAAALERGKTLVAPRIDSLLQQLSPHRKRPLIVYCARGGMRSASIARLLHHEGFQVRQLVGGYKYYRQHVLRFLENLQWPLIVLHGQTGVGKTQVLNRLTPSLDLEDLAQHRSSLFGGIHRQPRTQKTFEGLLFQEFLQLPQNTPCFIEGESRKVGPVYLPNALVEAMRESRLVLLTASLETRVCRIVEEYHVVDESSRIEADRIICSLKPVLGNKQVEYLRDCLRQGETPEVVRVLLREHYDPRYEYAMSGYQYALGVSTENLDVAVDELLKYHENFMQVTDFKD